MYANIKDAYISSSLPPLGRSDHNLVHLKPCYVPLVKRKPTTTRTVRGWSEKEALQGCFEITDWPALCEPHGEDIDGLTECITDYINLCVDCNVPAQTVTCYANNKPWITKDIKVILNEKKWAFSDGNHDEVRRVQGVVKLNIRVAQDNYKRKLENKGCVEWNENHQWVPEDW